VKELGDLLRQRSSARDRGAQTSAEALLDLGVDEPVGELPLDGQHERQRPSLLPQRARPVADGQSPVDQASLGAGRLREIGRNGGVHFLEYPGDGRQDRRAHLRHDLGDPPRVGAGGDREPEMGSEQLHQATEVVREREVEKHHVGREEEVLDPVDRRDHLRVIAVEDHAALRRSRRAGRVDEREEVLLADLGPCTVERMRVARGVLAAKGAKLVERFGRVHVLGARLLDPREICLVLDEAADSLRVLEDVTALGRRGGGVDRRCDGADLC
jgi:hypothetical protein